MRLAAWVMSCLVLAISTAHAQERPLPPIYVFGEDDDEELRRCGVSHQSAVAQVQSTLRFNRVNVSPTTTNDFYMYATLNAGPISNFCSFSIRLEFGWFGPSYISDTNETVYARTVFCDKESLLVWDNATAQIQINNSLADYANQCLSEYQALVRR